MLLCSTHAREAYVAKYYELSCELLNWLGMLSRCATARHTPGLPWRVIRLGSVVASAVGARYERRKQWKMTCLRLACACVIDAHLKKKHHPQFRDVPAIELLTHETIEGAFYAVLCLGTQFWLEGIDSRNFTESWENANAQTLTDPWGRARRTEPAPRASARRRAGDANGS